MQLKIFGKTIEIKAAAATQSATRNDEMNRFSGMISGRGYTVTAEEALKIAAVFRCVDIICKTMATMPLNLYRRTTKGKEKAEEHPLYNLMYILPNHRTTAWEFRQMYMANALLTRGGFAKIERNARGEVVAVWNVPTSRVSGPLLNTMTGERYIDVSLDDGVTERLYEGEYMYTPGFLLNDETAPRDLISIAADVMGLTATLNEYAQRAVDGVNPGGFIEHPNSMSDEAYTRFKEDFEKNYKGAVNNGRFLFLEEGAKANLFQRDMEKQQVLESRKNAVCEVCRVFGVPPHMCMDLERATFSNIEHLSIEFVRDCVNPWSVKLEQDMYRDLLTTRQKTAFFWKFNTNSLMRGDTTTRTQYYNVMRQTGVMSANDVRELEDMNPLPAEIGGDDHHLNGNMIVLENARKNIPKGAQSAQTTKGA